MKAEFQNFKELMEERRSVNFFDPEQELSRDLLKEIINMAVLAPSSFNLQPWEIIAISSEDKRQELYDKACDQEKVLKAPVVLAIIGDKEGYKRDNPMWDEKLRLGKLTEDKAEGIINYSDNNLYFNENKKVAFAIRNSSLLAMSIMFTAKYFGVDSHPMIGFDEAKLKEIYDLPDNKVVTMLICLGYFDQSKELDPRETRRGFEEIVKEY